MRQYATFERVQRIKEQNDDISFSFLSNTAITDSKKRVIEIHVDDELIQWNVLNGLPEDYDDDDFDLDTYIHPLLPHAGKTVSHQIGEQLIAFCETDFATHINDIEQKFKKGAKYTYEFKDPPGYEKKKAVTDSGHTGIVAKIMYYKNYEQLMKLASPLLNSCLYTSIFPPAPNRCTHKMLERYFRYIINLQELYRTILEFCFDVDFYPDELKGLTAPSRYRLFYGSNRQNGDPVALNITVQFHQYAHGEILNKDAAKNIPEEPYKLREDFRKMRNAIEDRYNMLSGSTEAVRAMQSPMFIAYSCRCLDEILYLELIKMLELDMKIKKCKNCGRYFTLKGNYKTEYCDRVPEGESLNCQTIAANEKFAQKIKENPALSIFSKAYKRYHARMKVGTVKPDAFKKWKYEAVTMRDKCLDGEVTVDEFREWIDGYFCKV